VDAAELWIWNAGAPLTLEISPDGIARSEHRLGPDAALLLAVPAHAWQAATSLGAWTLVSCVVAPAFDFAGFTLAPPKWQPG
jgi:predicted cupin superfamily sugar epimerase